MQIQVRTPLIFPDHREALAEFLRGLGYEPSTEALVYDPGFSREDASEPRLTPREKEVLRLMAKGHTYWEITEMLHLGSGTVAAHAENIVKKLRHGRPEPARWYAFEPGRALVLWLPDTVGAAAAEELARAVAGWMLEHLGLFLDGGTVRVIYGDDDRVLAEVPIEEDDTDE